MNRRNFITVALGIGAMRLATHVYAIQLSDQADTIVKLLKKYKFKQGKIHYLSTFADREIQNTIVVKSGANYAEVLTLAESEVGFKDWVGINLDDSIFITV